MMARRFPNAASLALLWAACLAGCDAAGPEDALLHAVRLEPIREGTMLLSSPAYEGRGTGQPGGERAAEWIARQFEASGLEPLGGDGTFLQALAFRRSRVSDASVLVVGADSLRLHDDFEVLMASPGDSLTIAGELVFVSYGIEDEGLGRSDLSGVDVAGKIVLLLGDAPPGVDTTAFRQAAMAQQEKLMAAQALIVAGLGTEDRPLAVTSRQLLLDRVELDGVGQPEGPPLVVAVSNKAMERIFGGGYAEVKARADRGEFVSRALTPAGSISLRYESSAVTAWNVIGLLRGSDPRLRDEVVAYTAHYDAFGSTPDGTIFPGAIDNALGTSQLLTMARAFSSQRERPRRSVLFMAVTGEEYGLLGTRAWLDSPTYPLDKVVAALNFDASDSEVYGPAEQAVGLGADQSSLGEVFRDAARDLGIDEAPDPYPEQNLFMRSDHFAFVQQGVPGLMLIVAPSGDAWVDRSRRWLGPEGDYHQPSDTVRADWDFRGALGSARLMALIGWRVANSDERPQPRDVPR